MMTHAHDTITSFMNLDDIHAHRHPISFLEKMHARTSPQVRVDLRVDRITRAHVAAESVISLEHERDEREKSRSAMATGAVVVRHPTTTPATNYD